MPVTVTHWTLLQLYFFPLFLCFPLLFFLLVLLAVVPSVTLLSMPAPFVISLPIDSKSASSSTLMECINTVGNVMMVLLPLVLLRDAWAQCSCSLEEHHSPISGSYCRERLYMTKTAWRYLYTSFQVLLIQAASAHMEFSLRQHVLLDHRRKQPYYFGRVKPQKSL